jgi:hypothetical protein
MSWLVVFLSYLFPAVLLFILLASDWLQRQSNMIPSPRMVQRGAMRKHNERFNRHADPVIMRGGADERRRSTMATAAGFPVKALKQADTSNRQEITSTEKCWRCGGLMVAEPCTDFWDNAENSAVRRCVQCGEVIDAVILRNRRQN